MLYMYTCFMFCIIKNFVFSNLGIFSIGRNRDFGDFRIREFSQVVGGPLINIYFGDFFSVFFFRGFFSGIFFFAKKPIWLVFFPTPQEIATFFPNFKQGFLACFLPEFKKFDSVFEVFPQKNLSDFGISGISGSGKIGPCPLINIYFGDFFFPNLGIFFFRGSGNFRIPKTPDI